MKPSIFCILLSDDGPESKLQCTSKWQYMLLNEQPKRGTNKVLNDSECQRGQVKIATAQ